MKENVGCLPICELSAEVQAFNLLPNRELVLYPGYGSRKVDGLKFLCYLRHGRTEARGWVNRGGVSPEPYSIANICASGEYLFWSSTREAQ